MEKKFEHEGHKLDAPPLPEGDYKMSLKDFNADKKTKAGDDMLSMEFAFISRDEKLKDKSIYMNILLTYSGNSTFDVVGIGRDKIDKLLKAAGVEDGLDGVDQDISALEQILGQPIIGTLKLQKAPYTNPSTGKTYWNSEIKSFKAL